MSTLSRNRKNNRMKPKKTVEIINGVETNVHTFHVNDANEIIIYIQSKLNKSGKKGSAKVTYDVSEVWDGIHTGRHKAGIKDWMSAYYQATMWADDLEASQWINHVKIVPPVSIALDNEWLRTTIDDIRVVTSDHHLMLKYSEAKHGNPHGKDRSRLKISEVLRMMKKADRQEDLGFVRKEERTKKNHPKTTGNKKTRKTKKTKWFKISMAKEEVLF
jgi:hypothetical protein